MIEYCTFGQSGIYDFRGVILPNIWEQLAVTEDYDELGLQLIGALRDGECVGALVARFLENEEVYINSLYVRSDCRRQGIGSSMLQELCGLASEKYPHCISDDFPLFLHTEYTLPEAECEAFAAFLRKQGFRDFLEKKSSFLLEKTELEAALSRLSVSTGDIFRVTELESYDDALFAEVFENAGFSGDPAFCFIHGSAEEPDFIVSAVGGDEGDFYLFSGSGGVDAGEEACGDTVLTLLRALCSAFPDFSLVIDGESNEPLPVWEELARSGGIICKRQEAGMYAVFEE